MINIFKSWSSHSKEQDIDDSQNPWAGLASYEDPETAERKLKFCGRDDDSYDLARLIMGNVFVTLYGKSGIGKTSLLNAGVFPELREEQYTPVSIRLGMRDKEYPQSYQTMIIEAVERVVRRTETIKVVEEQQNQQSIDYLWNYFARHRFYDKYDALTCPVIVFDQFEEVFRSPRNEVEILLRQLDYLNDKDHTLDTCEVDSKPYRYETNFRFVVSIREDDLYRLEDSIDNCYLPALKRCRYRLRSLPEQSAESVVLVPGEGLFKEEEQKGIVDTIIEIARNKEEKSISTNVLSLICSRIFVDFQKSGADHITPTLVDSFIKGNPFDRFYSEATRGFSNKEKSYIENHLVDSTGRRNSLPESDFLLNVPKGKKLLEGNARILQRTSTSSDGSSYRIELIHDSFCEPLVAQKEIRKQRRRFRMFAIITLAVCLFFGGTWRYMAKLQETNWKMKENAIRFEAEKAITLTDYGDSYSARLLALSLLPDNVEQQAYLPEAEAALRYACSQNSAIFKGHTNCVNCIHLNPDGKQLISCSYDGTIKLWDIQTGMCQKTINCSLNGVLDADFCPDGKSIISYFEDNIYRIIDISTGQIDTSFNAGTKMLDFNNPFCYSIDKRYVILSTNNILSVYDAFTYKLIKPIISTENIESICLYPDGQWLSVFTKDKFFLKVNIWNSKIIHIAHNDDNASLNHHKIDPKGEYIAGAFGVENKAGYARVWDAETGRCIYTLNGGEKWVNGVAYSNDGKIIVTTSMAGQVRIWDANSGASLNILKGHTFASGNPLFSADDNSIVTCSADGTIRKWDTPGVRDSIGLLNQRQEGSVITAYQPNGKQLLVASRDSFSLFNTSNKRWIKTLSKNDSIYSLKYSPAGNIIGLVKANNSIGLYDIKKKRINILDTLQNLTDIFSFSLNGKKIAFASGDSIVHIWNVSSGKKQQTIIWNNYIKGLSYIDNDRLMVVASDSSLSVFDVNDSICVKTWTIPPIGWVAAVTSPDGKYVLTSSKNHIYVWNLATGEQVSALEGHIAHVYACSFSPDGKYVVSTSHDTMVKVWDWRSGICMMSENWGQYHSVEFSPNGRQIAMANYFGEIRIWDYPPLQELIDQTRERFKNRQLTSEERRKYYLE